MKKIGKAGLIVFIALFVFSADRPAFGHAVVIDSSPKDNQALPQPPGEVILHFNAKLEKSLSRMTLLNGSGKPVPLPEAEGFGERPGSETASNILVVPMPRLQPGSYTLRYKVFSTDGHSTLGALRFTVSEQH